MSLRRRFVLPEAAALAYVVIALVVGLAGGTRLAAQQPDAQRFTFALLGDFGYYAEQEPAVQNVFEDVTRDAGLSFVVHVGDLSRPVLGCGDELLKRRLGQFNAVAHPLVFTPGDNDWTDCHDAQGVKGGDPLERLANLRNLMFSGERSLGRRTLPLFRQSRDAAFGKYRENGRWDMGGVTFVTLHVVGSNNNRARTPEADAEYEERDKANLAWLQQSFAHARSAGSRAVMIVQHANIFPEITPNAGRAVDPSGYSEIRAALAKEIVAFGKPVVLVHGDSHYFRIDNAFHKRPPRGKPGEPAPENFTRVETFGTPNHHWLHVTVDPDDRNVFTFRPRIVEANVASRK